MADLPILMSAPMVRALLREIEAPGTGKTQTRRVAKVAKGVTTSDIGEWVEETGGFRRAVFRQDQMAAPRFAVGDRLWVREAWKTHAAYDDLSPSEMGGEEPVQYQADGAHQTWGYPAIDKIGRPRPGMYMPRWASRITLTVTDVRVQRLHEISEADAIAEGIRPLPSGRYHCGHDEDGEITCKSPVTAFGWLWNEINGKRPGCHWQDNPWIVALTFRPALGNIDSQTAAS